MSRCMPLCKLCKYFIDENRSCEAYPDGISDSIYWNGHLPTMTDDNNIKFQPKEDISKDRVNFYLNIYGIS